MILPRRGFQAERARLLEAWFSSVEKELGNRRFTVYLLLLGAKLGCALLTSQFHRVRTAHQDTMVIARGFYTDSEVAVSFRSNVSVG